MVMAARAMAMATKRVMARAEARTTAMAATALVMIALVALPIAHFVTCNIIANAIGSSSI
jgi:hypothetical protein